MLQILGHEWIDYLKIDVEGSEFAAFKNIGEAPFKFTQLQLEIHHGKKWSEQPNYDALLLLFSLLRGNLRTMYLEPNIYFNAQACVEITMVQVDDCGRVVIVIRVWVRA